MKAIWPQVLQANFSLKNLDVVANLSISIQPSTLNTSFLIGKTTPDVENFVVSFGMSDINSTVSIFLGVDMNVLGALQLGSLLHSNQVAICCLQALKSAEVTKLVGNIGNIYVPKMTGFISNGVDFVIKNATQAAFQTLNTVDFTDHTRFLRGNSAS